MKKQRAPITCTCDRHVQVLALTYGQFIALTEIHDPHHEKALAGRERRASTKGKQGGTQPSLLARFNP